MPRALEAAYLEELRQAGLPGQGALARLLRLLRTAPDTHLVLADVVRMATETGLVETPSEIASQLKTLVDHGLLGWLPTTAAEPVFDTVSEPHSHLIYEDTAQIVDLHVSAETLLAILRQSLAEWPHEIEILVRFRTIRRGPPAGRPARDRSPPCYDMHFVGAVNPKVLEPPPADATALRSAPDRPARSRNRRVSATPTV